MEVGVYGLGRFGGFWASTLAREFVVKGYSRSSDRPAPEGVRKVSEKEVLACDVLFLTVAISAMEVVLTRIAPLLNPDSIVFDACSVKLYPVQLMERILPSRTRIIGTHPMFGPDSGRNGVQGLPLVFCPVRVDLAEEESWRERFRRLGLRVIDLTPDEHDREAARTQGITHFIGRVLDDLRLAPSPISTVGYARLLEIIEQTCNDPWQLFLDMQRFNPYTKDIRVALYTSLTKVKDQLESSLTTSNEPTYRSGHTENR